MEDDATDRPLARLAYEARRRGGCFTRQQALVEGVTPNRLDHLVTTAAIVTVHPGRGVYRFAGAPATWESDLHAGALVMGPAAVVSHRSAARLWDLQRFGTTRAFEVLVAGRKSRKAPADVRVHHTRWLPDDEVVKVGTHERVTSVTRTVRDLARYLDDDALLEVAVDAWRRGLTDPERLARCDAELVGAWGAARMRRVLEAMDSQCVRARSVPELRVHVLIVRDGRYPPHVLDHAVVLEGGRRVVFDLAWPELLAAVEVDSTRYHGTDYDQERDRERDAATAAGRWFVLRITTDDLERPAEVLAAIAAHLDRARQTLPARLAA